MKKIWIIFDGSNFYHLLKTLPSVYSPSSFNYIKFVKFLAKNEKINRKIYCIGAVREETGNIKSKKLMIQQQKFLTSLKKESEIHLGYICSDSLLLDEIRLKEFFK